MIDKKTRDQYKLRYALTDEQLDVLIEMVDRLREVGMRMELGLLAYGLYEARFPPAAAPPVQSNSNGFLKWSAAVAAVLVISCMCFMILLFVANQDGRVERALNPAELLPPPALVTPIMPDQEGADIAPPFHTAGQDVFVGDIRWHVLEAADEGQRLSGNALVEDKITEGRFVRVRVEIENNSNGIVSFTGINLVDDAGRTFVSSSETFMYTNDVCIFENINPNVPIVCESIYEVPADAKGLALQATDLRLISSRRAHISLGLGPFD